MVAGKIRMMNSWHWYAYQVTVNMMKFICFDDQNLIQPDVGLTSIQLRRIPSCSGLGVSRDMAVSKKVAGWGYRIYSSNWVSGLVKLILSDWRQSISSFYAGLHTRVGSQTVGRDVSAGVICDHWDQSQVSTPPTDALSVSSSHGVQISGLYFCFTFLLTCWNENNPEWDSLSYVK